MRTHALENRRKQLDELFALVESSGGDEEVQAHWASYFCILTSGFLETAVKALLLDYATSQAAEPVVNYVRSQFQKSFQNPSMDTLVGLLKAFSQPWGVQLKADTEGAPYDAVNSLVGNRNKIAHGGSVDLTLRSVKGYFEHAVAVIDCLENLLVPSSAVMLTTDAPVGVDSATVVELKTLGEVAGAAMPDAGSDKAAVE